MVTTRPTMNKRAFGQRLKFLRKLEQITQASLAEAVDVTVEHLSNLERGASAPSFDMIIKLAEALGTQPANLFLFTPFQLLEEQTETVASRDPGALDWRGYVSRIGVFERDLATEQSEWSDSVFDILGLPKNKKTSTYKTIRDLTLEEDRRSLDAAYARLEAGQTPQSITFRFRRRDGTPRLGLVHAETDFDEDGKPVRVFGAFLDITEQKRFEESLESTHQLMEQRVAERTLKLKNAVRRMEKAQEDRQRAEHQLTRTSKELSLVLDTITDGYFDQDLVTGKAYYSPSWGAMLGYAPEDLAPDRATWLGIIHPDDLAEAERRFHEEKQPGAPMRIKNEFRLKAKDGSWRWILSQSQVLGWDENGEPTRLVGTHTDITEHKAAMAALQKNEHLLLKAQNMARMGNWEIDLETNTCTWSDQIYRMLGLEPGEIKVEPPTLGEYLHPDDYQESRRKLDHTIATHEPYHCDKRLVRKDGKVIYTVGVAEMLDDEDGRGTRLVGIIQDITERWEAEQLRLKAEQRYRLLAERSADVIWTMDAEHRITYLSPSCERVYGYTEEELLRMPIDQRFTPESKAVLWKNINQRRQEIKAGNPSHAPSLLQLEHIRKDGSTGWIEIHATPIFSEDGEFQGLVGLSRDITQRKEVEDALSRNQAVLNRAQELARLGNWEYDLVGRKGWWSDNCYRLFGYEPDEVRTDYQFFLDHLHPDDREATRKRHARLTESGDTLHHEYRIIHKDGSVRHMLSWGEAIRGKDGRALMLTGTIQDVTRQKAAQAALETSEATLQRSHELARMGNWSSNWATGEEWWSDNLYRLNGYEPGEMTPNRELYFASLHPDDRDRVVAQLEEFLAHGDSLVHDYRIKNRSGGYRHIKSWVEVARDEQGHPMSLSGTVQDISELKQAEAELRESEERFRRLAENAPDVIFRLSVPEGQCEYVSPACLEATGYTQEEIQAQPKFIRRVVHSDWHEYLEREWGKVCDGRGARVLEYEIMDKAGRFRRLNQRNVYLRDEQGRVVALEGVTTDVTERYRAEQALRASEERYQRMFVQAALAMAFSDSNGVLLEANEAYARVSGYRRHELLGMSMHELSHPEEREVLDRMARKVCTGEVVRLQVEKRHIRKDGQAVQARVYIQGVRDDKGNLLGIMDHLIPLDETLEEL